MSTVIFTGSIPECPHCKKPTIRTAGMSLVTAVYYPPVYDEKGNNTNPDRNKQTSHYKCNECENNYCIIGNQFEGFVYGG